MDPPNPYLDADLTALDAAMSRRAGELLRGALVGRRDTAYLLLAAALRYKPDSAHPNSPHKVVRMGDDTALNAFWAAYLTRVQAQRHWALVQAVDAARLPPAWINRWSRDDATRSDDQL